MNSKLRIPLAQSLVVVALAWLVAGCSPGALVRGRLYEQRPPGAAHVPVISGATLTFTRHDISTYPRVTTNPMGYFDLGVSPGTYKILISHPDYADQVSADYNVVNSIFASNQYNEQLRRMTGRLAPTSSWQVAWRDGAPVTDSSALRLSDSRGKVTVLYITKLNQDY